MNSRATKISDVHDIMIIIFYAKTAFSNIQAWFLKSCPLQQHYGSP